MTSYFVIYLLVLPVGKFILVTVFDFMCLLKGLIEQKRLKKKSTNMKLIIDNFQVLRSEYEDRFQAGKLKHISQGAVGHRPIESAPDNSTF